jgi:hypothetical protein
MRPVPSRMRAGEWGILGGSLALAGSLGVPWALDGGRGWRALGGARWSVALTAGGGLLAAWLQATRRGPGAPVTATTLLLPVSTFNGLLVVSRLAGDRLGGSRPCAGAWLGLAGAFAVPAATYRSLRQDGIRPEDGPQEIEVVVLDETPARSSGSQRSGG